MRTSGLSVASARRIDSAQNAAASSTVPARPLPRTSTANPSDRASAAAASTAVAFVPTSECGTALGFGGGSRRSASATPGGHFDSSASYFASTAAASGGSAAATHGPDAITGSGSPITSEMTSA